MAEAAAGAVLILVVEDEPLQRFEMVDLVAQAGFAAVEACNADHAVSILEQRTDIRIVLTDIDMPGSMDGLRLAAAIRDRWPPIEIIVTTAGREPSPESLPERSIFLPKPVVAEDAIEALNKLAA